MARSGRDGIYFTIHETGELEGLSPMVLTPSLLAYNHWTTGLQVIVSFACLAFAVPYFTSPEEETPPMTLPPFSIIFANTPFLCCV